MAEKDKDQLSKLMTQLLDHYQHMMSDCDRESITLKKIAENICLYYDNIISCMPGNVYWYDKNGISVGCNQGVLDIFGFISQDQFKGISFEEGREICGWTETATQSFKKDTFDVIQSGKPKLNVEEPPILDVKGNLIYFLTSRMPLFDSKQNVIAVVCISIDITERKKMEQDLKIAKEQAERAKQQEEDLRKAVMVLAGSIAHDLRTPLVAVGAVGHTLTQALPILIDSYKAIDHHGEPFSQQLMNHELKGIEKFPQSLKNIVDEMNTFINHSLKALNTTITGIKSSEDLVPCTAWSCIQNALMRYPFTSEEKKLIHWDRGYEFNFMGNPILFYRVIYNLLKNALYQIHKNGQGEIYITAEQVKDFNILKIKDTAGQVSKETIQRIFNEFETTKQDGTGVGLAFCKLAMQSIGGDVECRLVDGDKIEFLLKFQN